MFRRLLWLGVGIGVGVVVVRMVTRQAKKFTPAGLAGSAQESLGGVAGSVRGFLDEVRDGMTEREDEILAAFNDGVSLEQVQLPWARGVGTRFNQFKHELGEYYEQ
ncbi:hypothetical protein QEZ54_15200 [Catellatospora sp. KI3]|uniref:hypothetical protein n=1 Tax=Catellatospora sp. KI3 TaxID=3041620 RepID=UPI00248315D2|nr:hypothetical protein [Catellatospora sp. KI3]MDI1462315.1 hypothetical protein [Catellatospora sp. KI3]